MKEIFYIDKYGETQCRRIYSSKAEKKSIEQAERNYSKQVAKEYWGSLTTAQKEVIQWCRENEYAQKYSLGMAQVRERELDNFYRLAANTNVIPKKVEKYEFVYNNFDNFKQYIMQLT